MKNISPAFLPNIHYHHDNQKTYNKNSNPNLTTEEFFNFIEEASLEDIRKILSCIEIDTSIIYNQTGDTLLHHAIKKERVDIAELLIDHFIERSPLTLISKNQAEETPFLLARSKNIHAIADRLLAAGQQESDRILIEMLKKNPEFALSLIIKEAQVTSGLIVGIANIYDYQYAEKIYGLMISANPFNFIKKLNEINISDQDHKQEIHHQSQHKLSIPPAGLSALLNTIQNIFILNESNISIWEKYAPDNFKKSLAEHFNAHKKTNKN